MKSFTVTESCDIILDGDRYRLDKGDRIMVEAKRKCSHCGGSGVEPHMPIVVDFDWSEDDDTAWASGFVSIDAGSDQEAEKLILNGEVKNGFYLSKWIAFNPEEVNGQKVEDIKGYWGAEGALLDHLRRNPGTREFKLTGNVE